MCPITQLSRPYNARITRFIWVLSLAHYLASRSLLWAGHVTRMTKNRAPKRLVLSWVGKPRIAGGQDMTYGRSLQRHLKHVGLEHADGSALAFTEWATLAQDRAGWRTLVTKLPFDIGQPHVRQPQCDTRVSPEDKQRFFAQRAAEAEQRRTLFNAAFVADTP
jgi:hypothetical protein